MKVEEIAARFDDRPGFRLVDFAEVGLPVYKLTVTAVLLAKKTFAPIEEFVLRSVHMGFTQVSDVASLLGLEEGTVQSALAGLIRSEDIYEQSDGTISLTSKGRHSVDNEASIVPREQTIVFYFDGLTREPRWFGEESFLYTPKQAQAAGFKQIRAFPARKPRADELDVNDVFEVLKRVVRASEDRQQLLRITEVRFAHRLFLEGVMLVYRSESNDGVQVGFAIDGRRSEEHEYAFLKADGPSKLGIVDSVRGTNVGIEQREAFKAVGGESVIGETNPAKKKAGKLQKAIASAKFVAEVAEKRLGRAETAEEVEKARSDFYILQGRLEKYEQTLSAVPVRPVPVYEHPVFLENAIEEARERLLIISPWITPAVVNDEMVSALEELMEKQVKVYIGFGISVEETERDSNVAVDRLRRLSEKHNSFLFMRMGDTHAKVLIKDSEFFIISSFNWLSFRGDPKRTFREEWGTYVGIRDQVNKYFEELLPRFVGG